MSLHPPLPRNWDLNCNLLAPCYVQTPNVDWVTQKTQRLGQRGWKTNTEGPPYKSSKQTWPSYRTISWGWLSATLLLTQWRCQSCQQPNPNQGTSPLNSCQPLNTWMARPACWTACRYAQTLFIDHQSQFIIVSNIGKIEQCLVSFFLLRCLTFHPHHQMFILSPQIKLTFICRQSNSSNASRKYY